MVRSLVAVWTQPTECGREGTHHPHADPSQGRLPEREPAMETDRGEPSSPTRPPRLYAGGGAPITAQCDRGTRCSDTEPNQDRS